MFWDWPNTIPDQEVKVADVRAVHEQLVDEHETQVAGGARDEHIATWNLLHLRVPRDMGKKVTIS